MKITIAIIKFIKLQIYIKHQPQSALILPYPSFPKKQNLFTRTLNMAYPITFHNSKYKDVIKSSIQFYKCTNTLSFKRWKFVQSVKVK